MWFTCIQAAMNPVDEKLEGLLWEALRLTHTRPVFVLFVFFHLFQELHKISGLFNIGPHSGNFIGIACLRTMHFQFLIWTLSCMRVHWRCTKIDMASCFMTHCVVCVSVGRY